jgi:serpin B
MAIFNNLSMLWIGAGDVTKEQIKNTLHISTNDPIAFLQAQQKLVDSLSRSSDTYQFQMANGLFANKGTTFSPTFLNAVKEGFNAKVQALDFSQPDRALSMINQWVASQTKDKIPTLLKSGDINAKTRMVLASALYFEGEWAHPFNPKNTKSAPFHIDGKTTVEVPTMHQTGYFDFVDEVNQSLLWIPFKRTDSGEPLLELVIALPKSKHEAGIFYSYENYKRWHVEREQKLVAISLPKFCYSSRLDLEQGLKGLGMIDAFSYQANFSPMNQMHDLYLNGVFHEVFTSLNEKGVTATAATASTIGVTSAPSSDEVVPFIVDRPFLFMILDHHAKTILFMGHVTKPELESCTK